MTQRVETSQLQILESGMTFTPIIGWNHPSQLPEETGNYLTLCKTTQGTPLSFIDIRRFYANGKRWAINGLSKGWVIAGWMDLDALAALPYQDGQPVKVDGADEVSK